MENIALVRGFTKLMEIFSELTFILTNCWVQKKYLEIKQDSKV